MAELRTTTIAEKFGLIAVEGYGGKVRLYTDDEMIPWICQEINVGVSLGRPAAEVGGAGAPPLSQSA